MTFQTKDQISNKTLLQIRTDAEILDVNEYSINYCFLIVLKANIENTFALIRDVQLLEGLRNIRKPRIKFLNTLFISFQKNFK